MLASDQGAGKAVDRIIEYLTLAVTIVIVAVPEGLPLAIQISLAYSVKKMKTQRILIKSL
jgi:Ca2+-transporting ATPase